MAILQRVVGKIIPIARHLSCGEVSLRDLWRVIAAATLPFREQETIELSAAAERNDRDQ